MKKFPHEIYEARTALIRVRALLHGKGIDEIEEIDCHDLARRQFRYVDAGPLDQDSCWLWRGTVSTSGYGTMAFNHPSNPEGSKIIVNRAVWMLFGGNLPGGLFPGTGKQSGEYVWRLVHVCRTKRCVRPSHMRLEKWSIETVRLNKRAAERRRRHRTHDRRIEAYKRHIESKRQRAMKVIEMRKAGHSWKAIAQATGASISAIDHILGRRSFKDLPRPTSYGQSKVLPRPVRE